MFAIQLHQTRCRILAPPLDLKTAGLMTHAPSRALNTLRNCLPFYSANRN